MGSSFCQEFNQNWSNPAIETQWPKELTYIFDFFVNCEQPTLFFCPQRERASSYAPFREPIDARFPEAQAMKKSPAAEPLPCSTSRCHRRLSIRTRLLFGR
jgi:hypothetical protein